MTVNRESKEKYEGLLKEAVKASKNAYAPYSDFKVGAALLSKNGKVFTGCNVENVSFGLSNCAERTAVFKAISDGVREFEAIAIYADIEEYISPCGACRQVLMEFNPGMIIICGCRDGSYKTKRLIELLPGAFMRKELQK